MTYKNKNTYFLTRESTDAAVLLSSSGTLLGGSRLQVGFSSVLRVSPFSSDQQQPEACFSHSKWQKHKMTNRIHIFWCSGSKQTHSQFCWHFIGQSKSHGSAQKFSADTQSLTHSGWQKVTKERDEWWTGVGSNCELWKHIFSFQFGRVKNCNEIFMLISMLSTTILYGLSKTQNKTKLRCALSS